MAKDILVWAPNMHSLQVRLSALLDKYARFCIPLSQTQFDISTNIQFVGFKISPSGIRPDLNHFQGLRNFPTPTSTIELKSFLKLAQLGAISACVNSLHLTQLAKKVTRFTWTDSLQEKFVYIFSTLYRPNVTHSFDSTVPSY